MKNDILVNEEEMSNIISKFAEEIKKLEVIYQDLDNKLKNIDGSSDIWTGNTQKSAYNSYLSISKEFPNSINQMKSLMLFLQTTLNNYSNSDKDLNENIEKNADDFDIN